jgi:hypothetical protein
MTAQLRQGTVALLGQLASNGAVVELSSCECSHGNGSPARSPPPAAAARPPPPPPGSAPTALPCGPGPRRTPACAAPARKTRLNRWLSKLVEEPKLRFVAVATAARSTGGCVPTSNLDILALQARGVGGGVQGAGCGGRLWRRPGHGGAAVDEGGRGLRCAGTGLQVWATGKGYRMGRVRAGATGGRDVATCVCLPSAAGLCAVADAAAPRATSQRPPRQHACEAPFNLTHISCRMAGCIVAQVQLDQSFVAGCLGRVARAGCKAGVERREWYGNLPCGAARTVLPWLSCALKRGERGGLAAQ